MGKRIHTHHGYITLFTCLLLAAFMTFALFVLEIVSWQMSKARAERAVTDNIKSLFGDYVQSIYEDYYLLLIDGSYQTESFAYLEERQRKLLDVNYQGAMFEACVEDVLLSDVITITDDHFQPFKQQIHDVCGYILTEDLFALLKEHTEGASDENTETSPEDESVALDAETLSDPREFFNGLVGNVLLSVVCPSATLPSGDVVSLDGLPSSVAGVKGEHALLSFDFFSETDVSDLLGQEKAELSENLFSKETIELAVYVRGCFQTWLGEDKGRSFVAEQEYILYGNDTDRENVLQAVQGIILLRLPFNYAYLCTDVSKRTVIKTSAAALAVLTGTSQTVLERLIMAAACYGEAVLDVKALLSGDAVPLLKTEDTWRLDLGEFLKSRISGQSANESTKGLTYEDYLTILLLSRGSADKLYYRMLDLITLSAREELEGFSMEYAITGATLQYSITLDDKFSPLPKTWNLEAYQLFFERSLSY